MLCPEPLPKGGIVDIVPWVVIEIVSPDDTISKTRARFFDYRNLGVLHVLQMDPEDCVAHRFDNGSMIEMKFHSLDLPGGKVPFDSEELFRRLRAELMNRRGESARS